VSTAQEETKALFRKAVERASLAPSVHNTQPWRFVVRPAVLQLYASNDRQLRALDPTGRQLVISCGCALFNPRVSLAADRVVQVNRLPDRTKPDLLARLSLLEEPAPWTPLVRLDPMISRRHTNRRDFFDEDVPPDVIYELTTAAEHEEAFLVQIVKPEQKTVAAQLSQTPRLSKPPNRNIERNLRHGRLPILVGLTAFRSLQFRVPMPVPSLMLWFATSMLQERDGCGG